MGEFFTRQKMLKPLDKYLKPGAARPAQTVDAMAAMARRWNAALGGTQEPAA